MRIIEDENLLENTIKMGARMIDNLNHLAEKHPVIGDVRGAGLFCGAELVKDRHTKEPEDEKLVQAVVADCAAQGVLIGATNRSLPASIIRYVLVQHLLQLPMISTRSPTQ